MNETASVRVRETRCELSGNGLGLSVREGLSVTEAIFERAAGQIFERDEETAVGFSVVVQVRDVRMGE